LKCEKIFHFNLIKEEWISNIISLIATSLWTKQIKYLKYCLSVYHFWLYCLVQICESTNQYKRIACKGVWPLCNSMSNCMAWLTMVRLWSSANGVTLTKLERSKFRRDDSYTLSMWPSPYQGLWSMALKQETSGTSLHHQPLLKVSTVYILLDQHSKSSISHTQQSTWYHANPEHWYIPINICQSGNQLWLQKNSNRIHYFFTRI
jgi:hypothetical protein